MAVMLKQLIDKFEAMEKIANETLAAEPEALVGVDSMPGSEHDQKVPAEAKKPDEEVAQGQPAGATSAEGAVNGGDAKPLNEGKLEMDQPLENPTQKPLVSDDALTAKTANDHLVQLVGDLLKDLKATKQASCGGSEGATHAAAPAKPAKKEEKKDGKDDGEKVTKIALDQETIDKIAAAQAAFMLGRSAADNVIKKQAEESVKKLSPEDARALIKSSCVKIAQEQGLSPEDAAAAADNAMAVAGVAPEQAAAADAAAADAAAADAGADAAAADAGAAERTRPRRSSRRALRAGRSPPSRPSRSPPRSRAVTPPLPLRTPVQPTPRPKAPQTRPPRSRTRRTRHRAQQTPRQRSRTRASASAPIRSPRSRTTSSRSAPRSRPPPSPSRATA